MATGLMAKYQWTTGFDPTLLRAGVAGVLAAHVSGYGPEAVADTLTLVNRMAMDKHISDIRAMAYMLATAARESKAIKTYTLPKLGKGGAPVLDKKTANPSRATRNSGPYFSRSRRADMGRASAITIP